MARRLVRVVSWLVTLGVTALVLAAVIVPRLGGATPYTVLTGSMAPAYAPGALVVVKPVDMADVRVGDVVTFQLRSGDPDVVTHRVVGIGWSGGERVLTTRGDANGGVDLMPVRAVQLKGEVWYSLPWVGRLNVLFTPDQHQLLVRVAAVALFGYAAVLLVQGSRPRRERSCERPPARHASAHGLPRLSPHRAGGVLVTPPGRHAGARHDEADPALPVEGPVEAPATLEAPEEVSA